MAKRWYVVHTYSGYENKVKTDLEHRIETYGLQDQIVDIQIPTEEVTKLKDGGERVTKDEKVFPGYVLVRMEVDDNTWAVVRNTPGVTGFAGIGGKPTPLRRSEYNKIMRRVNPREVAGDQPVKITTTDLEVGQSVRVVSGPLAGFDGTVSEVMAESGKIRIMINIFGQETPTEIAIAQVTSVL